MSLLPACLLLTRDEALARRMKGFLALEAEVRAVDSVKKLEGVLERSDATVALLDLRSDGARDALPALVREHPATVFVALGEPGSEPVFEAEGLGIYAADDLAIDRRRLEALLARALDHLRLTQENQSLRAQAAKLAGFADLFAARGAGPESPLPAARRLPGALRRFDNTEALLEGLVEGVAGAAMVSRAGIFCRSRDSRTYRLRAGLRCLEDTRGQEYTERDPLVHWLTQHAQIVWRGALDHVRDTSARLMLSQALDLLGAEVIVPLQAREVLLGWMFVGGRATGQPFEPVHLENLMLLAEHVSTTLENALLYEEVTVQKTLAETLLHSMPTGIVAAGEDGVVRWFNSAARQILEVDPAAVLNQKVEVLGSRLADVLRRALAGEAPEQPAEWTDPKSRKMLSVQARPLMNQSACLGAVALIQDVTAERLLQEKEEQLERRTFWTELAASMSHEVRNPLVAIKTFSQLLPERYADEEFRTQFSRIVTDEVDRLGRIIDQINQFAHPAKPVMEAFDVRAAARRGLEKALQAAGKDGVWVDAAMDGDLPMVVGDEAALTECFAHLVANALEALAHRENPRIRLLAREYADGRAFSGVAITVQDNGPGIPEAIREKVFSPFCTTKARGMGLGLPIVKRTVVDHGGRLAIDSGDKGTSVTLALPAARRRSPHEAHRDR